MHGYPSFPFGPRTLPLGLGTAWSSYLRFGLASDAISAHPAIRRVEWVKHVVVPTKEQLELLVATAEGAASLGRQQSWSRNPPIRGEDRSSAWSCSSMSQPVSDLSSHYPCLTLLGVSSRKQPGHGWPVANTDSFTPHRSKMSRLKSINEIFCK